MTQDRRTSGSTDSSLFERAEALIDEAVGKAAKGSYGEAAEKAQQALEIDPDNTVARELLDSYRHQVTDDDERRRRRRSIAAAAAAIEEMVESERLDEASSATDALVMQFGLDAPVEDLRQRIAEARASNLDFDELDAAIDAIRVGDVRPAHAPRNEPGGAIAAEIEEHLRAGRLDQASRALDRLETEPAAIERAAKLRTRIEEALHVAAEHRREEEILIATAAIEDRIRRGDIDEAAVQLADLSRRHGASAPVAELHQRLVEARALGRPTIAAADQADGDAAEPFTTSVASAPVFQSMIEHESSGRGRLIAIVVAVAIALAAGVWWLMQRDGEASAPPVTETQGAASTDGVPEAGTLDSSPSVDAGSAESTGALDAAPPVDSAAAAIPPTANSSAAVVPPAETRATQPVGSSPAAAADRSGATSAAPNANVTAAEPPPQAPPPTAPIASEAAAPPAVEEARNAIADTSAPPADPPQTEVVVEALPASESPPPAPAPPPPQPSAPPIAAEAAPAPAESAASSAPSSDSTARPEPAANQQQAAVAEPPRAAPPPPVAASGPALLGCGDPGVVCVKSLQVPQPRYPAAGRARRLSGTVVVMALVDERGRVVQARVDSGSFAFFNDAALDAAKRATFQPATRQGVAGQSWARLTFKFDQP